MLSFMNPEGAIYITLGSPTVNIWMELNCNGATLWKLQELKRFPTLQSDIAAASTEALERFRDESRKTVTRLVEMESSYLTVEFFRKLNLESDKGPNQTGPNADKNSKEPVQNMDRFGDNYLRRIGMKNSRLHALSYWLRRKFITVFIFMFC